MMRAALFAVACLAAAAAPASAASLIESYVAFLGSADHFSSAGERLTTAAQIIRQDRANYHKFGIRDPQDESDSYFADVNNRAYLEELLERGRGDPGVLNRIVNSNVLIRVDLYRDDDVGYVVVTLLD